MPRTCATRASILTVMITCVIGATTPPTWAQTGVATLREGPPARRTLPGRFDDLTDVIISTIAPDTWDEVGGEGSIRIVDHWGVAVISQTQVVHDEIENLLAAIRRVIASQSGSDRLDPPAVSSIESSANLARRIEIEKKLAAATSIDYLDQPLGDVMTDLAEQHGIAIVIDHNALEDLGLAADVPVTKQLSGVSLRSALRLILRDLGLTYIIQDEVLQITSLDEAESSLITRVYPVKDLGREIPEVLNGH